MNMNIKGRLGAFFVAFVLSLVCTGAQAAILFDGRFESGEIFPLTEGKVDSFFYGAVKTGCTFSNTVTSNRTYSTGNNNRLVTSPVRAGTYANVQTTVRNCDYRSYNGGTLQKPRQELGVLDGSFNAQHNVEYWYGFSFMVPESYNVETNSNQVVSLFQQKQKDSDAGTKTGISSSCCFSAISLYGSTLRFGVEGLYTSGSTPASPVFDTSNTYEWPLQKGKWNDVQINFKVCNINEKASGCVPFVKLYVNVDGASSSTPVAQWNNQANTTSVGAIGGPKLNLYRYGYNCTIAGPGYANYPPTSAQSDFNFCKTNPNSTTNPVSTTVYFDELLIGDANSSLQEIAPHVFGANSGGTGGANPAFTGTFESGQVNSNGSTVDGFLVQTFNGTSYVGVTGGGAGPASGYDTRVVTSESVGGSTVTPRKGAYFMRSEIIRSKDYTTYNGNGGLDKPRSNIAMSDPGLRTDFDDENWLGFSVFLPSNFVHDTGTLDGGQGNQIFTNYATSTSATQFTIQEYVPTGETVSHWILQYYTDATSTSESVGARTTVDLGPVTGDLGKWTDFVIRYRMNPFATSTNASTVANGMAKVFEGNKGILQIWKASGAIDGNGNRTMTKVVDIVNAPVGLVPHTSNKMVNALRLYKYHWKTNTTANAGTIWAGFDEVKSGRAADGVTYNSVYPGTVPCTVDCGGGGTTVGPQLIRTYLDQPIPVNTPSSITQNGIGFTTSGGNTNGVVAVDFTDGVNTVPSALFNGNATGGAYITGDLSSLSQQATLRVRYDSENLIWDTEGTASFDTWGEDGITITPLYASPLYEPPSDSVRNSHFGILKGYTFVNNTTGYKAMNSPSVTNVPANTTLTLQCTVEAGTTGKLRIRPVRKITGVNTYNVLSGTLGSMSQTTTLWGQDHSFRQWNKFGIYTVEYSVTTTDTSGEYYFTVGADGSSIGDSVVPLRCMFWKNIAPKTMTLPVVLDRADTVNPVLSECNFAVNENGIGTLGCNTSEPITLYSLITNSSTDPLDTAVIAGTGGIWAGSVASVNGVASMTTTGLNPTIDKYAYFVGVDPATLKSSVETTDPILAVTPSGTKTLKLGTESSPIERNNAPATFTYTSVKVYDSNPATNRTAKVLVELSGVDVASGISSATEANVVTGSGSLNAIADGYYWVLSSRPSGASYAISLGYRQIVTE